MPSVRYTVPVSPKGTFSTRLNVRMEQQDLPKTQVSLCKTKKERLSAFEGLDGISPNASKWKKLYGSPRRDIEPLSRRWRNGILKLIWRAISLFSTMFSPMFWDIL